MTQLFFSYSHADEQLRDVLEKHLAGLKRQGLIETWHDRRIVAGDELHGEISKSLEEADVVLLLVSADFLASDYCYDVEMRRAIERHEAGEARVIPVILRHCDWEDAPFGKLMAAPKDGRPITSWPDLDEAFLDVVRAIKTALKEQSAKRSGGKAAPKAAAPAIRDAAPIDEGPRSSNLRIKKTFSEADQDEFLDRAFEYMAAFFENSLKELCARNGKLTSRFRRIDADRFTAVVYEEGKAVARCKISRGGMFANGISYSHNDQGSDNSFNESISVEHDDQTMYLKPMGMPYMMSERDARLTAEGASEYYWSLLMQPLQ